MHSDIDLWEGGLDKFEIIEDNTKPKSVEQEQEQVAKPKHIQPTYDPFDESDLPF
ncbi:hypothetical protein D3C85_1901720 [compost metagenome]